MISLEQEVKELLERHEVDFKDNTWSKESIDFIFWLEEWKTYFSLEVKEKRHPYNPVHWPEVDIPEWSLFIQDDLSSRKILAAAPYSGLLVRNNISKSYYFYDVATLFLMPKVRVNRPVFEEDRYKGKWLFDLRNGLVTSKLSSAFQYIRDYLERMEHIYKEHSACYGEFIGEEIGEGGLLRTNEQRKSDFEETK